MMARGYLIGRSFGLLVFRAWRDVGKSNVVWGGLGDRRWAWNMGYLRTGCRLARKARFGGFFVQVTGNTTRPQCANCFSSSRQCFLSSGPGPIKSSPWPLISQGQRTCLLAQASSRSQVENNKDASITLPIPATKTGATSTSQHRPTSPEQAIDIVDGPAEREPRQVESHGRPPPPRNDGTLRPTTLRPCKNSPFRHQRRSAPSAVPLDRRGLFFSGSNPCLWGGTVFYEGATRVAFGIETLTWMGLLEIGGFDWFRAWYWWVAAVLPGLPFPRDVTQC